MMTDPISDLLTRIRNAMGVRRTKISLPSSNLKRRVAEIMLEEGFLQSVGEEKLTDAKRRLDIEIKYLPNGITPVLKGLRRISRPGQRRYTSFAEIPKVRSGQGVAILSTSKGILTDTAARKQKLGGEILCAVW